MVMVEDLTQVRLNDLWKEVKDEEDWRGDINERALGMVRLILEGSLATELLEELQVSKYKRSSCKRGYRNGHYQRNLYTMYGVIKSLRVPCARGKYESRILPRYQHRQEEINGMVRRMSLAGVRGVILRDRRNDYTIDVGASIIASEKEEAKVTYKEEKGYQPQKSFLFEAGLVLEDEFREGNIPAQAGAVSFVERRFKALPPSKSIACLRSDSAYYQAGVIDLSFERSKLFTITADQGRGVKENMKTIREW